MPNEDAQHLRKELKRYERRVRQLERLVKTSEDIARRSKAALMNSLDDLQVQAVDLERARDVAEEAIVAKDRFLAMMSHEIRTPMNGVIGCIDLLQGSAIELAQGSIVHTLQGSAESLMALLNDVLDFAKLQGGHTVVETTPFHLTDVLTQLTNVGSPGARAKGVACRLSVDPDVPTHVLGDPFKLRQIISNLTSNAIKFTAEGAVVLRAAVGSTKGAVRFSVEDSGIGMAPEVMDHIFDAFTQADASTTRRFGGTGLGLAISRTLVSAMGGELEVTSEPGVGSTFSFEISFGELVEQAAKDFDQQTAKAAQSGARESVDGLRVLVVDDTPMNLLLVGKMLERLGCDPVKVPSGVEAVAHAMEGGWDLVLMDCSMPDVDGYEATRRIRALPGPAANVRIVALTAHSMAGDRERCLEAGMDDYLSKPLRLAELHTALAKTIGLQGRLAA